MRDTPRGPVFAGLRSSTIRPPSEVAWAQSLIVVGARLQATKRSAIWRSSGGYSRQRHRLDEGCSVAHEALRLFPMK